MCRPLLWVFLTKSGSVVQSFSNVAWVCWTENVSVLHYCGPVVLKVGRCGSVIQVTVGLLDSSWVCSLLLRDYNILKVDL